MGEKEQKRQYDGRHPGFAGERKHLALVHGVHGTMIVYIILLAYNQQTTNIGKVGFVPRYVKQGSPRANMHMW